MKVSHLSFSVRRPFSREKRWLALSAALLSASTLPSAPALAQGSNFTIEEILVTARRREERLQEVPISMTVFNQQQLDNRNVYSGAELSLYTPSLTSNNRFGSDQASFAIRGFTQELRTTASVGVYFADVVAPRGGTNVTSGDGAGPGSFFDLQSVQVLKGPQGTLFGRNTTGGAVLLVPQKPTDTLEGYLEGSVGNYDMRRLQGVINIPLHERARLRLGVDSQERDGYLKNKSGIGPSHFSDVDYTSVRASLVLDLTDSLENYTIATYSDSHNNGSAYAYFVCNPAPGGLNDLCRGQEAQVPFDHYTIESNVADPTTILRQWQVINTTTWEVNDKLTIKNILSYADFYHVQRSPVYAINWPLPLGGDNFLFTEVRNVPGMPAASQTTFVEELQFQGLLFDDRLDWQAGVYFERSKPDGVSGTASINRLSCSQGHAAELGDYNCQDPLRGLAFLGSGGAVDEPAGAVNRNFGKTDYRNRAVYAQGTYELSPRFKLTAGIRYTSDETRAKANQYKMIGFPGFFEGPAEILTCEDPAASVATNCATTGKQKSSAPTWLLGLDYIHSDNLMLYAKYARGYRQGTYNYISPIGFQSVDEEEVDTYEIGMKSSFDGPIAGTFNIAVFYNDFQDQQLQVGFFDTTGLATPTAGPVNAGKSTIQGIEIDAQLWFTERLSLDVGYAYLDTELKEFNITTLPPDSAYNLIIVPSEPGDQLSMTPEHSLALTASYLLPVREELGDLSVSATYIYTDEILSAKGTPYGVLPSYELVNLNMNWNRILGSAFDMSLFVTNALDEEYSTYVPGNFDSIGGELQQAGIPRMVGARLRYNF